MSTPEIDEIVVKLSGGYPHAQLDRLLGQLEPASKLRKPAQITLDLSGLVFLSPTAQAVVAATFRRIVDRKLYTEGSRVTWPRAKNVAQYLARMDVIRPFVVELPTEKFKRRKPAGFRPVQHYTDAASCYEAARELRDAVAEATHTDDVLAVQAIYVCLGELAENVLFHASTKHGGFGAAQAWQKRSTVEVAIVDTGVGIRRSLTKNAAYADISDDVAAIETALEPMVTATPDRNTGLGLSLTRYLLRRNGGQLMVRSGKAAVYAGAIERSEVCPIPWPGTIVTLTARTDAPLDIHGAYDDLRAAGYRPDDGD